MRNSTPSVGPRSIYAHRKAKDRHREARQKARGMRGRVLNNHGNRRGAGLHCPQGSTVSKCVGGIDLKPLGGGNQSPPAVDQHYPHERWARQGCVVLDRSTRNQVKFSKEKSPLCPPREKRATGSRGEEGLACRPGTGDDQTGHSSPVEGLMIVKKQADMGAQQVVVKHAIVAVVGLTIDQMK